MWSATSGSASEYSVRRDVLSAIGIGSCTPNGQSHTHGIIELHTRGTETAPCKTLVILGQRYKLLGHGRGVSHLQYSVCITPYYSVASAKILTSHNFR